MSKGAELITAERERQVTEEGWTAEHDNGHEQQLALAGLCYTLAGVRGISMRGTLHEWTFKAHVADTSPAEFPWEPEFWKPTGDPVRDLTKAGALIAAALDALLAEADS